MANTLFIERMTEEEILKRLSRDDLITKLKLECGLDCNPHFKKEYLIQAIIDFKYGGKDGKQSRFDRTRNIEAC